MANIDIVLDAQGRYQREFNKLKGQIGGLGGVARKSTSSFMALGGAIAAVGGVAAIGTVVGATKELIAANTELNAGLANVGSLGVPVEDLQRYRNEIQNLSIELGEGDTQSLVKGLYDTISAVGDGPDALKVLEINLKAAKAGLAETADAVALTTAVTKGYGDTSAEAFQKVSDLAFQTVKLGQTTFPELAAAMGKVVPIAAALGVQQEEMFAQFATLTGVTGTAAEVSTQLRASYQALLKPTGEMATALGTVANELDKQGELIGNNFVEQWRSARSAFEQAGNELTQLVKKQEALDTSTEAGKAAYKELNDLIKIQKTSVKELGDAYDTNTAALAQSIVESVGFAEAMTLIAETADGNTDQLGKMFGSVEALTAVLALSEGQAETYAQKMEAMRDVTGATDAAFKAQTEGINQLGFAFDRLGAFIQVAKQDLGGVAETVIGPLAQELADAVLLVGPDILHSIEEAAPAIQESLAAALTGGESISLTDIVSFESGATGTQLSIGDLFQFKKLEPTDLIDTTEIGFSLGELITFDKLSMGDVIETNWSFSSGEIQIKKLKTEDFIESNLNILDIFDRTTKLTVDDIFTEKISIADLISLESKISPGDIFEKNFSIGSLFSVDAKIQPSEYFKKVNIGSIFESEQGFDLLRDTAFSKINLSDLVTIDTIDVMSDSFTKISIADIVTLEGGLLGGRTLSKIKFGDLVELSTIGSTFREQLASAELSFPFLEKFKWPDLPIFEWPNLPTFKWPTLPVFSWPALPAWQWPSFPTFKWPSFPTFKWPELPSFSSGIFGSLGGNALGGPIRQSGFYDVGEMGRERVFLPRGAFVQTNQSLMAGTNGMTVNVNISANVNSDIDMNMLARRVVKEIKSRV